MLSCTAGLLEGLGQKTCLLAQHLCLLMLIGLCRSEYFGSGSHCFLPFYSFGKHLRRVQPWSINASGSMMLNTNRVCSAWNWNWTSCGLRSWYISNQGTFFQPLRYLRLEISPRISQAVSAASRPRRKAPSRTTACALSCEALDLRWKFLHLGVLAHSPLESVESKSRDFFGCQKHIQH